MNPSEPSADSGVSAAADEPEVDVGADVDDEELGELLIREITIDGMCGVY